MAGQFMPEDMPAAAPPTVPTREECAERLKKHINTESKGLTGIIKDSLDTSSEYVERALRMFTSLVKPEFGCPGTEIAMSLVILTLYDIVMLIDDSSSMKKDPKLLPRLEKLIEQICGIYELANPNGINSIIFMNHNEGVKNVKKDDVRKILMLPPYTGISRIGTGLQRRVLDKFVPDGDKPMTKPLLVLTFTDGVIEGEEVGLMTKVIMRCLKLLKSKTKNEGERGEEAVAFQFICLGADEGVKKFFRFVDDHMKIGHRVDCVLPEYHKIETIDDNEWNGPDGRKWIALPKILLGALLATFDEHDEELTISDEAANYVGSGGRSNELVPDN
ncbi:hypothetical protein DFP73DRAFT_554184 [Morchella snyderi]|nr:hypothetical protein DFP73DRAFT_554184 [Morchella snyderi]